ncbi:MAG: hypothetical protein JXR96_18570 [Deltaproteobacteria bacterium]|nr:hypothetical protein [Deltaproteobacteria bacterium]
MKSKIDRDRLHRPTEAKASPDSQIREVDEVVIQVTQAFCPNGHNLVCNFKLLFDGEPGISLWVSDGEREGEVVLSPFHGDHSRQGLSDFDPGSKLTISCPICRHQLPRLSKCSCERGELFTLYLTPTLDDSHVVALCDIWGCHRSKVFDQAQLLSAYMDQ